MTSVWLFSNLHNCLWYEFDKDYVWVLINLFLLLLCKKFYTNIIYFSGKNYRYSSWTTVIVTIIIIHPTYVCGGPGYTPDCSITQDFWRKFSVVSTLSQAGGRFCPLLFLIITNLFPVKLSLGNPKNEARCI